MVDLKQFSGLPLFFEPTSCKLIFSEGVREVVPNVRKLSEMIPVLLEKNISQPQEFYYMYRDIHFEKDRKLLKENNLRYDITVIPSFTTGKEYNKTAGHYHPEKYAGLSYPEVYEILHGEATYLLQKSLPPYDDVEEVIVICAKIGDKVIIPPNWGHITINAGKDTLVMANWMADGLASIYKPYEEKQGGAYFGIKENDKIKFIPNVNYKNLPPLKIIQAKESEYFDRRPMYIQVVENIEKYKFLTEPMLIKDYKIEN